MEKLKRKNTNFSYKISKYLPVVIILLSLTIILGSTFAYFTDRKEDTSELTFSKVELSGETTTGINGSLRDVIPGTPLVNGALKFSKSIGSEPIYVRAKISFSLPEAYKQDADMQELLDMLRSATDFNIEESEQHGAVWSAKDGNYFYLVSSADNTQLMRVDTIETFVLSNEVVVPRDLESLEGNAQYMKSINFHVGFEAIQADNVSSVLSETKETFNAIFPENDDEKSAGVKVTFKGFDGVSNLEVIDAKKGEVFVKPIIQMPVDDNNVPLYVVDSWYKDSGLTNKYEFNTVIEEDVILYPLAYRVSQGLLFISNANGYSVKNNTCQDTHIVIPDMYNGKPVTEIYKDGFKGMSTLESIYLPDTITSLGFNAFNACSVLDMDALPSGLETIGSQAFINCVNLSLTSLPSGVTKISSYTFNGCTSLALTELPSGVTSIGEKAFLNCGNLKLSTLPSGVTTIGKEAFKGCSNITLTELPSGITTINESAFYGCSKLALTSLPDGVTSIVQYAFYECTNLALTSLPSGLTSLGRASFTGCSKLAITSIPTGITSLGRSVFSGCTSITSLKLPSGLTLIDRVALEGCTNLKMVELPGTLTSLDISPFNLCNNLTYILCETEAVATLMQGQGFADSYIYVKNADAYSGFTETEIVINDSLTIYQVERSGYMWIRNGSDYYKCIYMHDDMGNPDDSFGDDWMDDPFEDGFIDIT